MCQSTIDMVFFSIYSNGTGGQLRRRMDVVAYAGDSSDKGNVTSGRSGGGADVILGSDGSLHHL